MLQAVNNNLGQWPEYGLADAGYRSAESLRNAPIELIVALGREGKQQAQVDALTRPQTAAMAAKLQTAEGKAAYAAACGSPSRPTAGSRTC